MIDGHRVTPHFDLLEGSGRDAIRYGSWDNDQNGGFVLPSYVGGSDYSGNLVERSNYDVFHEQLADHQGVEWWETPGGHGTFGILVRVDADARVPEIGEFFEGLSNYPVADEDAHSNLEMESQQAAWEDYGRNDFERELKDIFSGVQPIDEMEDDVLSSFYWQIGGELYSCYPENEQGDSWHFPDKTLLDGLQKFIDDFSPPHESDNEAAFEQAQAVGAEILWKLLKLDEPDLHHDRYDYNGLVSKILRGHREICRAWKTTSEGKHVQEGGVRRAIFRDLLARDGVEAALEALATGKAKPEMSGYTDVRGFEAGDPLDNGHILNVSGRQLLLIDDALKTHPSPEAENIRSEIAQLLR